MCKCANGSVNSGFSQRRDYGPLWLSRLPPHNNMLISLQMFPKSLTRCRNFSILDSVAISTVYSPPKAMLGGKKPDHRLALKNSEKMLTLRISSDEFVDNELNISSEDSSIENMYTEEKKKRKVTCRDNCISLYEHLLLEILGLCAYRQHWCSLKAAWSFGKKGKALHIPRRTCHNLSSRLDLLRAINIIKKQINILI